MRALIESGKQIIASVMNKAGRAPGGVTLIAFLCALCFLLRVLCVSSLLWLTLKVSIPSEQRFAEAILEQRAVAWR